VQGTGEFESVSGYHLGAKGSNKSQGTGSCNCSLFSLFFSFNENSTNHGSGAQSKNVFCVIKGLSVPPNFSKVAGELGNEEREKA
jgi:hypothetical protein